MMNKALIALTLTTVLVAPAAFGSSDAPETDEIYVATLGNAFHSPVVIVPEGSTLALAQVDPARLHDLASSDRTPEGRLFGTEDVLTFGETATVLGVDALPVGEYGFFCSVHPSMKGTLQVV